MALTKCPDCGSDISTEAPACPKCGRPNSKPKKAASSAGSGCAAVLLAVIVVGILISVFSGNSDDTSGTKGHATAATTSASEKPAAKPINLSDSAALDDRYGIAASVYCAGGADDYLRQVAKWDFKWDHIGFLDQKFDKYLKRVSKPGVLTTVSDKIALQNGFGAYQHVELFCDYDTQKKKVLRYWLDQ